MKRIVLLFLTISLLFSCEKMEDRRGTLTVAVSSVSSDDEEVNVTVYPYMYEINRLRPIAESVIKKKKSNSVTFLLNEGNYIVYCEGFSTPQTIQIQAGEEETLRFF